MDRFAAVYNRRMLVVEVRDLVKTFSLKHKEAGLRGSFKSIVRPELRRVEAVKRISFSTCHPPLVTHV